jgi:hypothetical protein
MLSNNHSDTPRYNPRKLMSIWGILSDTWRNQSCYPVLNHYLLEESIAKLTMSTPKLNSSSFSPLCTLRKWKRNCHPKGET